MFGVPASAFLICLMAGSGAAMAQTSAQTPADKPVPAQAASAARPNSPTRDPNTPGYVKAKGLPDGAIPAPKEDGNFIIGPTHNPAPEMNVNDGVPKGDVFEFTMESKDSKIYTGIARVPNTFAVPDPADPNKVIVHSYPAPYTRRRHETEFKAR
jgi:enterochelin esterase family protein